jgi:carboxymethylenebutenolidase
MSHLPRWILLILTIAVGITPNQHHANLSLENESIFFLTSRGDSAQGYLALPMNSGKAAVIILHDGWGLDSHTRSVCNAFAHEGFVILGIDLYRGVRPEDFMEAHELERGVPEERVFADINAAITYLKEKRGIQKIGLCGFRIYNDE